MPTACQLSAIVYLPLTIELKDYTSTSKHVLTNGNVELSIFCFSWIYGKLAALDSSL
jgi:hypothetical protein